jgi:hypothetical protein
MDALYSPGDVHEIEHGWCSGAAGNEDDTQVGLLRTQELIVRQAHQGLETETHEASPTQDGLKEDLSMVPTTGTMNPVTESMAPRMPPEGHVAAKQEQDIHSSVRGLRTAQMAAQEATTVPSVPARLPVVNRRLPPAFILRAQQQVADALRAKGEVCRLRRAGQWRT